MCIMVDSRMFRLVAVSIFRERSKYRLCVVVVSEPEEHTAVYLISGTKWGIVYM